MTTRHSVLVIDDSEDDRDVFKRLLRSDPTISDIQFAGTGQDGIAAYQASHSDCILLDYHLPGYNGVEVLEALRESDAYASVVMLTGQGSEDVAVAAMKAGASDYVAKDTISADGLRRAITNAIEKTALQRKIDRQQQEQELFLRTLIHDVVSPIRHLMMFTELLAEDVRAERYDEILEHSDSIGISAKRIRDLIDTLASYALAEGRVEFEPVCMNHVVSAAMDNLAQTIEERRADVSHDPLPTVEGHAPQLILLLQNLIGNAVKYCDSPMPAVRIQAARQDGEAGRWSFDVRDNGIGIPENRLAYIFEPFKRLWSQDRYEGTGLGLAICRKIVERHGGTIWCESVEGQGSRFRFTLGDMQK